MVATGKMFMLVKETRAQARLPELTEEELKRVEESGMVGSDGTNGKHGDKGKKV
jgi:hypothetical protein